MQVRKFQLDADLQNLEEYLRNQYLDNKNMTSWLPERLHDLIYRMGAQEPDGGPKSADYIFLWEENEKIVADYKGGKTTKKTITLLLQLHKLSSFQAEK